MNAAAVPESTGQSTGQLSNVLALPYEARPRKQPREIGSHFKVKTFTNASGSLSYRVDGYKLDGSRVRVNFSTRNEALAQKNWLEAEYLQQNQQPEIRATNLSDDKLRIAEAVFLRFEDPVELLTAVDFYLAHGKGKTIVDSLRLDDAKDEFEKGLTDGACEGLYGLRELSKVNLRRRIGKFVNSSPNLKVCDVTPDTIKSFLDKQNTSAKSKDNDRRAVSRFFTFCIEKKWAASNPCRKEGKTRRPENKQVPILSLTDCRTLLAASETLKDGRLAPYVAVCLFAGLRPFEAARLTWEKVNLNDGEIRLEGSDTKTGQSRVIAIPPTLKQWLEAYEGQPFFPGNWRRDFDELKASIGYGNPERLPKRLADTRKDWREWPVDVMRHTAVSCHFRQTGSFGLTAEYFGNSEAIIKRHYKGRVSTEDAQAFYDIAPTQSKKGTRS